MSKTRNYEANTFLIYGLYGYSGNLIAGEEQRMGLRSSPGGETRRTWVHRLNA